jgi:hypothetical protein
VSDARNSQVEWRDLLALSHREILVELLMPLLALAAALIAGAVRCWPLLVLASAVMFMFWLARESRCISSFPGLAQRWE